MVAFYIPPEISTEKRIGSNVYRPYGHQHHCWYHHFTRVKIHVRFKASDIVNHLGGHGTTTRRSSQLEFWGFAATHDQFRSERGAIQPIKVAFACRWVTNSCMWKNRQSSGNDSGNDTFWDHRMDNDLTFTSHYQAVNSKGVCHLFFPLLCPFMFIPPTLERVYKLVPYRIKDSVDNLVPLCGSREQR